MNGPTNIALTFADYVSVKNRDARRFEQLSEETIRFVEEIERVAGAPVSLISTRFDSTRERVLGLLCARAYRGREHTVLTIDTEKLLKLHHQRVTLSPINSGSTVYNPQLRGPETFQPLAAYPFEKWRKKRGSATKAIAELAVDYTVPNIGELVLRVERRRQSHILEIIYEK